jgi:altronate hydrolase
MLYEIDKPPTAANAAIRLHERDNVAIARTALAPGQAAELHGIAVAARTAIPAGHKIAIRESRAGEPVYRYGNPIGYAIADIHAGEHVHTNNLGYKESHSSECVPAARAEQQPRSSRQATFLGYPRDDGRAGTRNYIAVVAASNCAAHTAELIAASFAGEKLPENVDGVIAFPHGEGCAQAIGPDTEQLQRTLMGILDHPNVSAAVILGLGCEVNQIGH